MKDASVTELPTPTFLEVIAVTYLLTSIASMLIGLVVIAFVVALFLVSMSLTDVIIEYRYTEKSTWADRAVTLRDAVQVAVQKTRRTFV